MPKNPKKKPKKTKKNQKNPKKPKKPKNQFPISNVGQSLSQKNQKKPKKTKKTQKKQKKTSFQFRILAKTNAKKNQKKPKKTKKNQCQFGNFKKPKKTKKNQCQFADFGVATGFFWFFLGEHPPFFRAFKALRALKGPLIKFSHISMHRPYRDILYLKFSCLYLFPFSHKVVPQKASGGSGGRIPHFNWSIYRGGNFFYLNPG